MLEIEELITLPELEKCCPIQPRFKLDIPNRKGGGGCKPLPTSERCYFFVNDIISKFFFGNQVSVNFILTYRATDLALEHGLHGLHGLQ